jgi:phosphate transport system permease protein
METDTCRRVTSRGDSLDGEGIWGIERRQQSRSWIRTTAWLFSGITLLFFISMLGIFLWQSRPLWHEVGAGFVTGKTWFYRQDQFGAAPMIYGTLIVSIVALGLAVPLGLGTALFMSEILPNRWRQPAKALIELLAGVPSVVYGLLGVLFLRNWVYNGLERWDPISGDTLLTAGLLLAVMLLPTVTSLGEDALRGIPGEQREAARALGLTRWEMISRICLPQARNGLLAAVLLAMGRGLGEGIAVFFVVGLQDNQWPASILSMRPWIEPGQTLTSKLVGAETHLAQGNTLHWAAMMGLGLLLMGLVTGITWLAMGYLQRKEAHATRT